MSVKYNSFLEINPSFESVVDIDADKRNENLWRDYIVGEDMCKLMEVLCQSLNKEDTDSRRSFWINGSYGTGKSYAAILLKHLLEEKPEIVEDFMAGNHRLAEYKNRFKKCRKNGDYLVIWKTGCSGIRTGDMMLIEMEQAIREALVEKFGDSADLGSHSLYEVVREKMNDPTINWEFMLSTTTLGDDYSSVKELQDLVEEGNLTAIQNVASVLRNKKMSLVINLDTFKKWVAEVIKCNNLSKSGIFLIWDEFTEYVSNSDDHIILQQISEFTKEEPFYALFIVHKSTDLVARVGGSEQYEQISHRFHEVEFHLTADASLDLIAGSINIRNGMENHWDEARKAVIQNIHSRIADMEAGPDSNISGFIKALCPMHPMTVRLLARVAENYAAAERTMFRFMKDRSNEDIGFAGYISKYGPDDQACWLTPEWLWDYFFTRDSDFLEKETKVAEYIRHYEDNKNLVEADENAHRLFKIVMLLLAVMSSAKGLYSGRRTQGGIAATVDCLSLCLAGVMSEDQVKDLLATLEECKLVTLDTAANGVVRLQLPFSTDGGSFQLHYDANDKKYTRYQMFSKDGIFSKPFEDKCWDSNDVSSRRMKICVCCAETNSIKSRLDEILKDLDKYPYKLGLLVVIVKDDNQYLSIQEDLRNRVFDLDESRLTIALVKKPLTEEIRKRWLNAITKQDMATESGQTGAASQQSNEANIVISTWVQQVSASSQIIAWNGTQVFNNIYGMSHLSKTIRASVIDKLFPYAPEKIVITNTAYKSCSDSAPLAGIQRATNSSQLKSVLTGIGQILDITDINEMADMTGNDSVQAVSELAKVVRDEIQSGKKVVLSDLWSKLMKPPFGYYDTIACGILLGYVFTGYKNSDYTWTDSAGAPQILVENNLKTMVYNLVKGKMTTDYISSGSETFRLFRDYIKDIMALSDVKVANETECWHNMRVAVTNSGSPFWTLKYLPQSAYNNAENQTVAKEIIDNIQKFIEQNNSHEEIMGNVNQAFSGRGKIRSILRKAFQDKNALNEAFRSFLFEASSELKEIVERLKISSDVLSDKLHIVMQDSIYTWIEEQVLNKIPDIISEYHYLETLNDALGKTYHSIEEVRNDLANQFKFVRIPISVVETLDKPWFGALKAMEWIVSNNAAQMTDEQRQADSAELNSYGKSAMEFLRDGKTLLSDLLDQLGLECTAQELDTIYSGLKDIRFNTPKQQFDKDLNGLMSNISQARHRIRLKERWLSVVGSECGSVKKWCSIHNAPIYWIVAKEQRDAFTTLTKVQNDQRTMDTDVMTAINILDTMDHSILTDDAIISEALLKVLGDEYAQIFSEDRIQIMAKAKMKLGNDMSNWDITELNDFRNILKKEQQEKAKKEKLSNTKNHVKTMDEGKLRNAVQSFLDAHPEFFDAFNE